MGNSQYGQVGNTKRRLDKDMDRKPGNKHGRNLKGKDDDDFVSKAEKIREEREMWLLRATEKEKKNEYEWQKSGLVKKLTPVCKFYICLNINMFFIEREGSWQKL